MAKYNPGQTGGATRPIIRTVTSEDVAATYGMAVHQAMGLKAAPNANPGMLFTNPAIAGVQVKGQLGGGYFAPPKKSDKFV